MTVLPFTKMQGLGNDFMVVDATQHTYPLTAQLIQQWAGRHWGIGFDQLLLIEPARQVNMDFFYRIFNADGSEAEQCGNGLRCITKYIFDKKLSTQPQLKIGTLTGLHITERLANGMIRVVMGKPTYLTGLEQISIGSQTMACFSLGIGNPHTVLQVGDITKAPVAEIGSLLNQSNYFPQGVNVEFMQVITRNEVKLRVFERTIGETLACGSGACAAAVAGYLTDILSNDVTVLLPGGELLIQVAADQTITMIGPAVTVYEGSINL